MTAKNSISLSDAEELYDRYVRPLESEHKGEYAAVSPHGALVLGKTFLDTLEEARSGLGAGSVVFKIGDRVVGKWRTLLTG
jgi:hypothetical protein